MWELLDGWSAPSTRQKSGSFLKEVEPGDDAGIPGGMLKEPAAMVLAEVMVVLASFKAARLSQVSAASGAVRSAVSRMMDSRAWRVIICPWEGAYHGKQ